MTPRPMEFTPSQDTCLAARWHARLSGVAFCMLSLAAFALCLALALLAPAPAHASGLSFVASCPEDGATRVPAKGQLWVKYDHNIAAVAANAQLAHVTDAKGRELSSKKCKVSLPDFQTEFGLRQYLLIDVKGLKAGATYHIKVDAGVTAKNGDTCDDAVDIEFTTAKKGEKPIELAEPTKTASGSGTGDGSGSGGGSGGSAANSQGDIELVEWSVANRADDEPRPTEMPSTMAHYATLTFSWGIDYYPLGEDTDLSAIHANWEKVSLQTADGTPVEGVRIYSLQANSEDRQGTIYIDLDDGTRLAPLSEYHIVVEPGLTTYSGAHTSTERFEVDFRTNGDLGGGVTVAGVVVGVTVVAVLVAGIAVQVRRRKREQGVRRG